MSKQTVTKTVEIVRPIGDGTCDVINDYEIQGWRVKFIQCHTQLPENQMLHTVVVFEREVQVV